MPKRSRLEVKKTSIRFKKTKTGQKVRFLNGFKQNGGQFCLLLTENQTQKVSENDRSKTGRFNSVGYCISINCFNFFVL
jgi:hypothetical protein